MNSQTLGSVVGNAVFWGKFFKGGQINVLRNRGAIGWS